MPPSVVWEHRSEKKGTSFRIVQKNEDRGYDDNRCYVAEFAADYDALGAPIWLSLPGQHAEFLMRVARELRARGSK